MQSAFIFCFVLHGYTLIWNKKITTTNISWYTNSKYYRKGAYVALDITNHIKKYFISELLDPGLLHCLVTLKILDNDKYCKIF